jgi:hypothetical protein
MTIEQMFAEVSMAMQPGYRQVTVLQLLPHTDSFRYGPGMPIEAILVSGGMHTSGRQ